MIKRSKTIQIEAGVMVFRVNKTLASGLKSYVSRSRYIHKVLRYVR